MRILLALGGNAMTGPDGEARPGDQVAAADVAMGAVADLIAQHDVDVVLSHGNGPQVGNLLEINEISAAVVPPTPLDWCGAQTQGSIGFVLLNALDNALLARGVTRPTSALVTRALVAADDPGFEHPTKPIGRYLPESEAASMREHGETWEDRGERGWRRVVASPEPLEIVDADEVITLVDAGYVVVANGGGGIPVVRREDGRLEGVEAVIDKDLGAALLAEAVDADLLVIATDVSHAFLRHGTPEQEALGRVGVAQLERHAADGHFASGSMGPKVDAVCRFVRSTGRPAVITDLAHIVEAVTGDAGTRVEPATAP